jgi:pyridoxal phosphate enzyme (YggS family)
MSPEPHQEVRRAEIAAGLETVTARVRTACQHAGRDPGEVTVIVVTKLFPAGDVRLLAELGVRDVGENRHQEAEPKHAACADLGLTWHFVGQLQSNKAAAVAAYADVVHSVDRAKLLPGLSRGALSRRRPLDVLVQVSLDPDEAAARGRSGVAPDRAAELAERVFATEALRLRGVMGVAPLGRDSQAGFATLARAAEQVRQVEPGATWVSAGMSGDLEEAVRYGATHVRVGSAILGNRPPRR